MIDMRVVFNQKWAVESLRMFSLCTSRFHIHWQLHWQLIYGSSFTAYHISSVFETSVSAEKHKFTTNTIGEMPDIWCLTLRLVWVTPSATFLVAWSSSKKRPSTLASASQRNAATMLRERVQLVEYGLMGVAGQMGAAGNGNFFLSA